jgi:hypothetical protein
MTRSELTALCALNRVRALSAQYLLQATFVRGVYRAANLRLNLVSLL